MLAETRYMREIYHSHENWPYGKINMCAGQVGGGGFAVRTWSLR
jgi:hypothetical protein